MTTAPASLLLAVGTDTLAYLKTGSGPALVIVHGVGGHKEDWQAVMAAFADQFRRRPVLTGRPHSLCQLRGEPRAPR
jgi:pimeloyl-ACP methyl ester carboxylesterase